MDCFMLLDDPVCVVCLYALRMDPCTARGTSGWLILKTASHPGIRSSFRYRDDVRADLSVDHPFTEFRCNCFRSDGGRLIEARRIPLLDFVLERSAFAVRNRWERGRFSPAARSDGLYL